MEYINIIPDVIFDFFNSKSNSAMFDKSLIYFEFMNAQILTVNKVKNKNIIYYG